MTLFSAADTARAAHVAFWICVGCIAYVYAGYPLLLAMLAAILRRKAAVPGDAPAITLLIAAHNEAAGMEAKILNALALNYPAGKLQILVASDGSVDETDAIVRRFSARGVELVRIEQQRGKTHAQNVAMERATGEIVVFSDATTHYHADALRYIAGNYADPRVGAVSGRYTYLDPTRVSPTGLGALAFSNYDTRVRSLQSRVWTLTGCCGCIYSVRRALYTPLAGNIISDLVQPLHVIRQGFRVTLEERALAFEDSTATPRQEFAMRVRVVARAMIGLLSVPEMLMPWREPWAAFQLWSHKLLRWAVPLFLIVLFASTSLLLRDAFYLAAFAFQTAFYCVALLSIAFPLHRRWKLLGVPLYYCTINAAALAGFIQLLRGRRYVAWQPARNAPQAAEMPAPLPSLSTPHAG